MSSSPIPLYQTLLCRLDGALRYLYRVCSALAALFIFCILLAVVLQMATRWLHINLLGVSEFAGYFMSASAFLMAPQALLHGSHIRMDIFLVKARGTPKVILMALCLVVANLVAAYVAYYAVKSVHISYVINDVSQGIDATPLWIPQLGMAVGLVLFAVALLHFTILWVVAGDMTLESVESEAPES